MQTNNEIIKANKKYEGQPCNICKKEIVLGDTIHICPNCQSINHEDCWQNNGGCNNFSCKSLSSSNKSKTSSLANKYKSLDEPLPETQTQLMSNMVACRWCGKPILRGSKKCKYCNEYQTDADRKKAEADTERFNYNSIEFSGLEWVMLLFCTGFAFIYGFYIYITGNSTKGIKFMKYSIFIGLIFLVIKYAFNMLMAN